MLWQCNLIFIDQGSKIKIYRLAAVQDKLDFLAGQVTFKDHLHNGQGSRQVMLYSNKCDEHDKLEVAHQGKQNVRAACPKDKLHGIQVFL